MLPNTYYNNQKSEFPYFVELVMYLKPCSYNIVVTGIIIRIYIVYKKYMLKYVYVICLFAYITYQQHFNFINKHVCTEPLILFDLILSLKTAAYSGCSLLSCK